MAKSKKDLDRDMMFKKIMPALADNPFSTISTTHQQSYQEDIAEDELSSLRSKLFSHGKAEPAVNLMEELILEHLDSAILKFNACHCDRCRRDIVAVALNLLPPKYVVADRAHLEEIKAQIPSKQVMDALIKAVIKVRSHPRH